ncbi:alpha-mannosidase 2x isoform X1 [Kryptolebias marmoratus]|uniref:Alpha-mannosidase n=1 Tax=Kryptolebias marmoratus TaxID=37003 RepID=A0A3Q2ZIW4_KRYMA|nr:alpha-mannosidase 2x isoform X1 [Kryptolebias marmoratus]XP_024863136.1 alpha-mannosidase 2x isoform X1 [Kryptolebias marmoratus]XP_024863137.1 alpha-mannosidase 2x isoform X1 [Kryptolebias marmoratus]
MKLRKQVTVCGGAIFCVAVFSLYLMLDRVQHDPARRQNGGNFPRSQISVLQNRIEQLEQLLEENHQIISHIKDSVMELTDTGAVSPSGHLPFRSANGSWVLPFDGRPTFLAVKPQDCQFAEGNQAQTDVQMLDVYSILKFDNPDGGVWKQGFDITYEPDEWDNEPLQVFVVPHSHNDPGWVKTFDKYFTDQTQHILNNMVVKLAEDPRRKFIWSEISFFAKWWESADVYKQEAMRKLILGGQLEIVTGGWVMTDEATAHYFAMIDQLIEGHQWLERNLGVTPISGWAVDPFGHSATMPYLLKMANLTSMLIQRIHYSIKKHFASTRSLEFMWRQAWDTGSSTDMFCHMMPFYSYDVPHTCGPDPKICCQFDFKRLPGGRINCPWKVPPKSVVEANVAERAQLLLDQYRKKSKLYRSKVLLVPLGDDFRYDKALEWDQQYINYQKLFDYMNSHPELHVQAQFGTLTEYFNAVYKAYGVAPGSRPSDFPVLSGDFFAYADREDHYWTGYFTSRPFYKSLDRVIESHLRGAEILYSLAVANARHVGMEGRYPVSDYALLVDARRSVGLFQHHDAITGTAKENVVIDYGTKLLRALIGLKRVIINAAHFLVMKNKEFYRFYQTEPFLETDDRRATQDSMPQRTLIELDPAGPRYLVLFNPIEQERLCTVTVLVNTVRVRVLTEDGQTLPVQLSAQWSSGTQMSAEVFEATFMVRLPPLGLAVFHLYDSSDSPMTFRSDTVLRLSSRSVTARAEDPLPVRSQLTDSQTFYISSQALTLGFSGTTGLLESIKRKDDPQEVKVQMQFMVYGTRPSKDKSGAYLFLPDGKPKPYNQKEPPVVRVVEGPLFSEVVAQYQHFQQTVRIHNVPGVDGLSVDMTTMVDIRDQTNKELAMRLVTSIQSGDVFYTDLNGFQIQPRRHYQKLPLQGNFYPMPSQMYLQDSHHRLTLHTAQALGVSSLESGQFEVIMDRRLMQDDNRGLGQGLKDNKKTANHFRLLLERRSIGNKMMDSATTSFPSIASHMTSAFLNHEVLALPVLPKRRGVPPLQTFAPLKSAVPCDFHLLNLRSIQSQQDALSPSPYTALILHRLALDCGFEAQNLGFNCTTTQGQLSVSSLFKNVDLHLLQPMSLTLMQSSKPLANDSTISLQPMEISTFRIKLR